MAAHPDSELARALAPLHREYIRRLDEMAARVKPEALLREPITRDEKGVIASGPDGLALRFDVADSETGSTFEVRSARNDAPGANRLKVGALNVDLKPGCWEALAVDCRFDGPPTPEDAISLASLLRVFAELGHSGAFCPRGAAEPWAGCIHSVAVTVNGPSISAIYDLGSCPPGAFDVLVNALIGFGRDRAPLARVIIGGTPLDPLRAIL